MANFFSARYWKALYFKAMGGQATAVDPNAMSGSFAGSASFTGTLDASGSSVVDIAGAFAGSSTFTGDLKRQRSGDAGDAPRKKRRINIVGPSLEWARDNLGRFLGPNADKAKLDALLAKKAASAEAGEQQPKAIVELEAIAAAPVESEAAATVIATAEDDEDEIIALLLAA
jgi:hypothetical protein